MNFKLLKYQFKISFNTLKFNIIEIRIEKLYLFF